MKRFQQKSSYRCLRLAKTKPDNHKLTNSRTGSERCWVGGGMSPMPARLHLHTGVQQQEQRLPVTQAHLRSPARRVRTGNWICKKLHSTPKTNVFSRRAALPTYFFTIPAKENAALEERTGDSTLLMDDLTGFVKDLLKSDKGKHRKANFKKKMTLSPKKEQESSVSSTVSTVEVHNDWTKCSNTFNENRRCCFLVYLVAFEITNCT